MAICGVGMNITAEEPYTVQMLHEGRSAHRSGLIKPGDVILSIAHSDLQGKPVEELTRLMLGPQGSPVQLILSRGAATITVWLLRAPTKLTPLQVQKQRDLQRTGGQAGGEKEKEKEKPVARQQSRYTENSFLLSQSSYASIGDEEARELGSEKSFDPDAVINAQPSMLSQYSFDPERMGVEDEKSFDPEMVDLEPSAALLSQKSFDPELLVAGFGEKSFDPDEEMQSVVDEKSFDPDAMGFMSEKSFDPESAESLQQLSRYSINSQQSFDPDKLDFGAPAENSFDPDRYENMTINSEMSFDPDKLFFEKSRANMAMNKEITKPSTNASSEQSFDPEDAEGAEGVASEQSFDPEGGGAADDSKAGANTNANATTGGKRAVKTAAAASEKSFDPDGADMASEQSFDPDSQEDDGGGGAASEKSFDPDSVGAKSEKSFDPDSANADADGAGSEKSFDPDAAEGGGGADSMSEQSFDPEGCESDRAGKTTADDDDRASQKSFDPDRVDNNSVSSGVSFDPERNDLEQAQHSAAKRRANIPHQQPVQSRSFPYAPSYASDKSFDASEYGGVRVDGSRVFDKDETLRFRGGGGDLDSSSEEEVEEEEEEAEEEAEKQMQEAVMGAEKPLQLLRKELSTFNLHRAEDDGEEEGEGNVEEELKSARELQAAAESGGSLVANKEGLLAAVLKELEAAKSCVSKLQTDAAASDAVRKMLAALNDLTGFQSAVQSAISQGEKGKRQAGLGFKFRRLKTGLFDVRELKAGGAAMSSKLLRVGDRIVEVDGTSCKGLSSQRLGALLLGPQGSECVLKIHRGTSSEPTTITLTRQLKQKQPKGAAASEEGERRARGEAAASTEKRHAGLGFTCKQRGGVWMVSRIKDGGFAATSGTILVGDALNAVDGVRCTSLPAPELIALLRGRPRSACTVELTRGGKTITVQAERNFES